MRAKRAAPLGAVAPRRLTRMPTTTLGRSACGGINSATAARHTRKRRCRAPTAEPSLGHGATEQRRAVSRVELFLARFLVDCQDTVATKGESSAAMKMPLKRSRIFCRRGSPSQRPLRVPPTRTRRSPPAPPAIPQRSSDSARRASAAGRRRLKIWPPQTSRHRSYASTARATRRASPSSARRSKSMLPPSPPPAVRWKTLTPAVRQPAAVAARSRSVRF